MIIFILMLVQLFFETLPISSSFHVHMAEYFLHSQGFLSGYRVLNDLVQAPTIMIIGLFFWQRVLIFIKASLRHYRLFFYTVWITFIALLPAMGMYFFLIFFPMYTPVWIGLGLGAVIQLLFSYRFQSLFSNVQHYYPSIISTQVRWPAALIIGCVQAGSLVFPGMSRFGSTYVAGRLVGFSHHTSFYFSWMLQAVIMGSALIRGLLTATMHDYQTIISGCSGSCLVWGLIVCIGSYYGLWLVYRMAAQNNLKLFGWYLALLSCLSLLNSW
jgi:undecaprenyl pyrophosphate phosphatase UppP